MRTVKLALWSCLLTMFATAGETQEIERIESSGDGLAVICADQTLQGQMVIVGIGVAPNSRMAETAGLELSVAGSIAVDRSLHTSNANIFAAGDCADAYHVVTDAKTWIPLALRANRAGWAVADNVIGKKVVLDGVAGTSVFRVFDFEGSNLPGVARFFEGFGSDRTTYYRMVKAKFPFVEWMR